MSEVKSQEELKEMWAALKSCVEDMERDLDKNLVKANSAAGRRVRADLRELKRKATELIRELVALDKSRKG